MFTHPSRLALLAAAAAFSWPAIVSASEHNPVAREPRPPASTSRLDVIVKLKPEASAAIQKASTAVDRGAALAKRTGLSVELRREISTLMLATRIELGDASAEDAMRRLRADPQVEYVAPDQRRYPHAVPNDPLFTGQWYLQAVQPSAINAAAAWDIETGSSGVVVAVLDTGVLYDHPDLARGDLGGKLLPGYDFVTNAPRASDGNGRDNNPEDSGDWVNDADRADSSFSDCEVTGSSWHGTRVAGVIGALTHNGTGVSGISWNSLILPVRVLAKCGGSDSDILAGMRWAAGLPVTGVPTNPTPARILNLSLGGTSPCQASYRDVIQELTALKVLLVVSAGNEGTVVSSPANCPGVAAVAAIRHAGSKVGFSNLGPEVAIAAPGGNCVNINGGPCLFSLDTTSNAGTTTAGAHIFTDQTNSNLGTSFSAPIVSGIAALMLARNHNLSTAQLLGRLRNGARDFPTTVDDAPNIVACHVPANTDDVQLEQCLCTPETCGAGMVNAANSVADADRPIAAIAISSGVSAGQAVSLNATGSAAACGRTLVSQAWAVIEPATNPPAITHADTSMASVLAPASGSITVRLTVTDNLGRVDLADVVIGPSSASSSAPANAGSAPCATPVVSGPTPRTITPDPTPPDPTPPAPSTPRGSGGGGGGAFEVLTLGLLGAWTSLLPARRRRSQIARCI
jgi:serine protease